MGIFTMTVERVDIETNKERAMEIEAHMLEVERARAMQIWRENTLKSELAEVEESERRDDIDRE